MSNKKPNKPKRRKTFQLPTEGPLYDSMDDLVVAGDDSMLGDLPMPSPEQAKAEHLKMVKSVLAFDQLVWRGFKTVLLSMLFFSVSASVAGGLFGRLFPSYCRFIFGAFDAVDFQPWIGGLTIGLAYGATAGALIGCVIVLSAALYQSRTWRNLNDQPPA